MKKIFALIFVFTATLSSCLKDEMPAPPVIAGEAYEDMVINELMTKDLTNPYYVDGMGDGADWVELYNSGTKAVNIAGMYFTDKVGIEAEYLQIPSTDAAITTIPPKGFIVLICGAADATGADIPTGIMDGKIFMATGLSASNDHTVAIYTPEKVLVDESADFNGLTDDKTFGRTSDGGTTWDTLSIKTPGAPNDGTVVVEGRLTINEFMCSNDVIVVPGDNGDFPDWIEIYNTGDTPIDMGGWYTTDDLNDMVKYQLPTNDPTLTTVPAKGFLILYCDGLGAGLHTNFKLSGSGEGVGISKDGLVFVESYSYCDVGCDIANPPTNNSLGRDVDGGVIWTLFTPGAARIPTPGASNN